MLFLSPVGSQPQEVAAFQESPTSVHVFWEVPEPIGQTTGYRIYFTSSSATSSGSMLVDDPLANNEFVHSLTNGETYTFSVAGRSMHFESEPSTAVNLPISLRKLSYCNKPQYQRVLCLHYLRHYLSLFLHLRGGYVC